jgi:riboflavin biosynthesis pyrimidine reductase
VVVNMVASVDGASTGPDTRSGSLSSEADRRLFHALRSVADVVLAGAGTVRAENYGAPRGDGRRPRLAVVSASLALDPAARFFREPDEPSIVLTTEDALAGGNAAEQLTAVADVRAVGEHSLDWPAALRLLRREYDAMILLVEGGPSLNTQLVAEDLVDEFRLTVAPLLVGGSARRVVAPGAPAQMLPFTLDEVDEEEGFLFLRYLRDRH